MKQILIKALVVSFCLTIFTGCSTSNEETIAYIKDNFQTNQEVIYQEPLADVNPDHTFSFTISEQAISQINKDGYTTSSIFTFYIDDTLTQPLEIDYTIKDNKITITPDVSTDFRYDKKTYTLPDSTWGLYNHYYLVQSFDLKTGKKLDKPLVTVFTIDSPLETPIMRLDYEKDNSFTLTWDNIDNAQMYYLMRIDFDYTGKATTNVVSSTNKTSWNSNVDGKDIENVDAAIFKNYMVSEDEQYTMDLENWWDDKNIFSLGSVFGIVAKNKDDTFSSMSYFDTNEYNRQDLVCQAASFASNEINISSKIETIEQIPYQLPTTSCTGGTIYGEVVLDVDSVVQEVDGLHVPYGLKNSTLQGSFIITNYEQNGYQKELDEKRRTIAETYRQVENNKYRYQSTKVVAFNVKSSNTLPDIKDTIFTTSKLETFIAANMIDGAAMIDISSFENIDDMDYFYDLMEQIRNQNPLILEALDYYYDTDEKMIYVHYLYDNETRSKNQQTIRDEVKRISGEIITPSMSDVEKVYAINQYICDNTVYNDDAVSAAPNIYTMHEDYYYANTAEGVFLHGNAVCEGYASAFMLLADAVGIKSIMVTGYTFANLDIRHAWNRVLIDDQWYVVDVTHNDMDETPNSVLLLADITADKIYQPDEYFLLDDDIDKYRATGPDTYEYYQHLNLAVSTANAPSTIVNILKNNRQATIRVPLETTEVQFDSIAQSVVDQINHSITYFYINGVLTVKKQ